MLVFIAKRGWNEAGRSYAVQTENCDALKKARAKDAEEAKRLHAITVKSSRFLAILSSLANFYNISAPTQSYMVLDYINQK